MPPVLIRLLIIAKVLIFVAGAADEPVVTATFGLWPLGSFRVAGLPGPVGFEPWQLLTDGFLHANLLHLGFNLFGLHIFGREVLQATGVAHCAHLGGLVGGWLVLRRRMPGPLQERPAGCRRAPASRLFLPGKTRAQPREILMDQTTRRHANVVNIAELKAGGFEKGGRFALASKALGKATGARGIGCSYYEVPPGRTAFPNHYHCANEESIYVLEGSGTLRLGTDEVPVGPGDYATFPVGPAHTHQLLNTGDVPMRYLCFSTMLLTEVVGYPDSKKIGAFGYATTGESMTRIMVREESGVDYYDREV